MPSVRVNDSVLVDSDLETLVSHGHSVSVPRGTDRGDCRTERSVTVNRGELSLLVDSEHVGDSRHESFSISGRDGDTFEITAQYDVYVQIEERHYQKLCRRSCPCEYQYSTHHGSSLTLRDTQEVMLSAPIFYANFEIVDQYADTTKARFSHSDNVNTILRVGDSHYTKHNYVFSEVIENEPLNTLQVVAEPYSVELVDYLISENELLRFPTADSCLIILWDFFHPVLKTCSVDFEDVDFSVRTDKLRYLEDDVITVTIEPEGEYTVRYAGEEYETSGELELNASSGHIEVSSGYVTHSHVVQVQQGNNVAMLFALGSFSLCSLGIIRVVRRYGGAAFD